LIINYLRPSADESAATEKFKMSKTDIDKSEKLTKWRLILGKQADPAVSVPLEGEMMGLDGVLDALYDSDRTGGLGSSSPNINRWLGDIRKYFPTSTVQLMQKDAIDRLNLKQLLLQPETLENLQPDVNLVATLLSLNKAMPQNTRETARMVIRKVVEDLEKRLAQPLREAIRGALNRAVRNRKPKYNEIDWHQTIRANLKNYQADLKTIIPEHLIGRGRKGQSLKNIILLVDQSGSMAASVVYASIFGAVMASIRAVKTQMVVFDTEVVDLTAELKDPIDLMFGTQLGGGTDIHKALTYTESLIQNPSETILILISDLFEGGNVGEMLKKAASIRESGVTFIALLALSDQGKPSFDKSVAAQFANMDIPSFACTPDRFPDLMAAAIQKKDLWQFSS
jgi:Mg-chelatase subunit ChlD